MSAQHHTPGPWLWEKDHDTGGYVVWTRQPHTGELATVNPDDINGKWPAKANAHLIAAAPDLLEACQNMRGLYDTPVERRRRSEDPLYDDAVSQLRAAIAKATGESQ